MKVELLVEQIYNYGIRVLVSKHWVDICMIKSKEELSEDALIKKFKKSIKEIRLFTNPDKVVFYRNSKNYTHIESSFELATSFFKGQNLSTDDPSNREYINRIIDYVLEVRD